MSVARVSLPLPAMREGAAVQGVTDRRGAARRFIITGRIMVSLALWVHVALLPPVALAMTVAILQPVKGAVKSRVKPGFSAVPVAERACFQGFGDG